MRIRHRRFFIFLIFSYTFILSVFYFPRDIENLNEFYLNTIFNEIFLSFAKKELIYRDYCETQEEWLYLKDRQIFFKANASFFFLDLSLVTLNFICNHSEPNDFLIRLNINFIYRKKIYNFNHSIENFNAQTLKSDLVYQTLDYRTLDFKFNFYNFLARKAIVLDPIENAEILVYISDSKNTISKAIRLKFKKFFNYPKRYSYLCIRPVLLNNKKEVNKFKWWIEINRFISGFDRIEIIELRKKSFNLDQNYFGDIIKINKLNCFLNQSFEDFINFENNKSLEKFELINELLLNECYLNNIDKYDLIAVYDLDEVILPRKYQDFSIKTFREFLVSKKFSMDSIVFGNSKLNYINWGLTNSKDDMRIYLTKINNAKRIKIKNRKNLFFKRAWFVPNSLLENICKYYTKNANFLQKYNYSIGTHLFSVENNMFKLNNRNSVSYLKCLCNMYSQIVKTVLEKHSKILERIENFARFFYIKFDSDGRTVHNTDWIFNIANFNSIRKIDKVVNHFQNYLNQTIQTSNLSILNMEKNETQHIDYEFGFTSYFKEDLELLSEKIIDLDSFGFDLNYFLNFLKIVEKLN